MSLQDTATIADDHQIRVGELPRTPGAPPCPLSPWFEWVPQNKTPDNRFPRHILVTAALATEMLDGNNPLKHELQFTRVTGAEMLQEYLPGISLQYRHEIETLAAKGITTVSGTGLYTLTADKAREVLQPYLNKKC